MTKYKEITKPVVPQWVADWYEENKDDFEHNLAHLIKDYLDNSLEDDKLESWFEEGVKINDFDFDSDYNIKVYEPIQILVNMHQFGYKVKKEKLYTAKLKSTGEYLHYDPYTHPSAVYHMFQDDDMAKKFRHYHFTEYELRKYNAWENKAYKVDEVKENE